MGIFLDERIRDRKIGFGDHIGEPVWQEVPGRVPGPRSAGSSSPRATPSPPVEQQRYLGATAPSLYDLRNLFQVNVEEGRDLWAMVYLLHGFFGRDGRDEADELLQRHSGDAGRAADPRRVQPGEPGLADVLLFSDFTDRDGKYQLGTLEGVGVRSVSRTCEFMLNEEAHHMFVGQIGVDGSSSEPYR